MCSCSTKGRVILVEAEEEGPESEAEVTGTSLTFFFHYRARTENTLYTVLFYLLSHKYITFLIYKVLLIYIIIVFALYIYIYITKRNVLFIIIIYIL